MMIIHIIKQHSNDNTSMNDNNNANDEKRGQGHGVGPQGARPCVAPPSAGSAN